MKFLRMLFCNTPEEVAAVRRDHIPDAPEFVSYTLHGNDAEPAQLDLYAAKNPEYNTPSFCSYHRGDAGILVTDYVAPRTAPGRR